MELDTILYLLMPLGLAYQAWFVYALVASSLSETRPKPVELLARLPKLNMQFSFALAAVPIVIHTAVLLTLGANPETANNTAPFAVLFYYALPSTLIYLATTGRIFGRASQVQNSSAPA